MFEQRAAHAAPLAGGPHVGVAYEVYVLTDWMPMMPSRLPSAS